MPSSGLLTLYHPALDAGSSPAWIPVFTGMTHSLSSPAWLGIQLVWIYVFTGMTEGRCGIQPCLDSRFHGNDTPCVIPNRKQSASDWGSSPSRHPALDAGSSPAWIPVFTGMTEEGREWLKGDTGMTSGTRMSIDKSSITIKNPTGQALSDSFFCYLKWLHPCGKPQGMRHLKISGNFA